MSKIGDWFKFKVLRKNKITDAQYRTDPKGNRTIGLQGQTQYPAADEEGEQDPTRNLQAAVAQDLDNAPQPGTIPPPPTSKPNLDQSNQYVQFSKAAAVKPEGQITAETNVEYSEHTKQHSYLGKAENLKHTMPAREGDITSLLEQAISEGKNIAQVGGTVSSSQGKTAPEGAKSANKQNKGPQVGS